MATFNQWKDAMEEAFEVFETINERNARAPRVSSVWLHTINKSQMQKRQRSPVPKPISGPQFVKLDEQPQIVEQATPSRKAPDPQLVLFHYKRKLRQQRELEEFRAWLQEPANPGISSRRSGSSDDEATWDRPFTEMLNWDEPDAWRIMDAFRPIEPQRPKPRPTITADSTRIAKPTMRELGDLARVIPGLVSIGWSSTTDQYHRRTIARVRFTHRWQAQRFRDSLSRANWMSFNIRRQRHIRDEHLYHVDIPVKYTNTNGFRPATDSMHQEAERAEAIRREEQRQRWEEWNQPQARYSSDPTRTPDHIGLDDRALERELALIDRKVKQHLGYDPNAAVERTIDKRRQRRDADLRLKRDELDAYLAAQHTEEQVVAEMQRRGQLGTI